MTQMSIQQALDHAMQQHRQGHLDAAEAVYRQILQVMPGHPGALHLLGLVAGARGRVDEAVELIKKALDGAPREAGFAVNAGRILSQARRWAQAAEWMWRAVGISPGDAQLLYELGVVLQMAGDMDAAVAAYEQAIRLNPGLAEAHGNLGAIYKQRQQFIKAEALCRRAAELKPGLMEAHANLGGTLHALGRHDEAVQCFQRALEIDRTNPMVYYGMALALGALGREEECIAAYRAAIGIKPDYVDAHINLGNALRITGDIDGAAAAYRAAIAAKPDCADAHNNLGLVLDLQGRLEESLACYWRAVELNPADAAIHSNLLYSLHFHPSWLERPLALLEEHRAWDRRHGAGKGVSIGPHANEAEPERRLRIGYVSPDLRQHGVGRFLLPLLQSHDKGAVEVFCYTDVTMSDGVTERLRAAADQWRSTAGSPDDSVEEMIRRDQIDILVDLTMHMRGNRLGVFAQKPAPVQITYLAYCSTTGLEAMDYRITDRHLDPPERDLSAYAERSLFIESYWCYAAPLEAGEASELPALAGDGVTFGCLNNFCKVSRGAVETWARVLRAVSGSRLVIHANPGAHREELLGRLARLGVDPGRCGFVGLADLAGYFGHYRSIDIALDPFPYAGGTTTCDALFMGVPVVTLAGGGAAGGAAVGRGGVSILSTCGCAEWIARDKEEYVRIAADLAGDLPRLADLRRRLRARLQGSPLMDAPRFAREMERAYREAWRRWCGVRSVPGRG